MESNSLASNIDCSLRYSNEFVLEEQAADLAQMLGLALSQVVNNPDQPVGHVELLNGRSAIEMALSMRRGSLSGTQSVTGKFWKEKLDAVEAVHFPATPSADYIPNPQDIMTKAVVLPPGCVNFGEVTADVKIQLAWALLVSIYTNAHDIVFGMTNFDPDAAMLDREEMEGLSFTTSLTLIHIDKGQTVREALYNAQEWCKGASAYKDMDLQRISQLSESCAAVCRFQTLIAILPEGVQSDSLNQPSDTLGSRRYPLELQFQQSEGALNTRAVFDSRVLESAEVRRILQQFEHIFSQLYSVPDGVSIGSLDMVNTEDWNDLKKWNPAPPAVELDSRFCVHNVIHQRCQNQTDAPAVCAWDGEFTYQQLDHLAECYAQQLKQHNVRPETFVPLYFEKSRWTVVAQLAVLKAGGAFCMLDPGHPMSRLREMCKDLQPSLVLTSLDLRTSATDLGLPVLVFNEESPQVPVHHYDTNAPPLTSKSPMCVVFTSGSTGRPRGTVLEHRAFYASAMAHTEIMALRPHSRVLQFSGYAFDASIMDHISTLLAGGCICIPSEFDRRNHLATAATNLKTNWALLTPSVIRSLSPDSLPTMKTLVSGGEPLSHDIITRWSSRVQLMNAYGPSECSVMCTINPSIHIGTSPKSLGYSSGGVNWILDPEDPEKPVPIGAIGELVIEGPIVGQGYLNSPERTAAAFIKRPEWLARLRDNKHDYGPLYRSGDLVKYGPDGTIWYIGRRDSQIKLRGQRIELSEVEHHVKQCFPDTQDAVVELVSPDDGRTPVLAAFISSIHRNDAPNEKTQGVLAPATQSFHDQVNTAEANLTERVQSYMIPTMFFPLAQMPLSGSGKVDRRFLRKLASSLSRGDWDAYVSSQKVGPTNEKELILHRAWARVLNIAPEQLGIHDDFFRIGGDSITSMQASSNCRTAGIQVTVADISRHKTIAQLAKHCAQTAIDSDLNNQLMMEDGDGWTELSPIQQMFFDLVPNGESYFNQSALLRLSSTVNPSDVSQAVTFLVRTHAMLRSRYRKTQEGPWLQSIADDIPGSYRFRHHTVNSEDEIQALCEKTERSMNVQEGPVFAVDLFDDMQNKAQHLFLVAHHLVVDMVSWRIMLGDLEELLLRPGAALVPPASTPFLNWCRLQSQYAAQQLPPEKALPIHGIERYIAPSDYWGSPSNTFGDAEPHAFSLDQEPTQKILGTANYALRTQPAELILAAMLHAFSQSFPDRPTPTVFTEGHGREPWNPAIDLTRTVGWFTSMYPVSVSLRSTDRLVDAVSGVKDARRQVPANGWAYFSSRYLNAQGRETFRQTEPMEILFNYLGLYQQLERPGALIRFDNSKPFAANAAGKMPRFALLDVAAFVSENRLHVHFSINRHMKHLSALRQWVQQCESSLRQVAAVLPTLSQRYTPSDFPLSSPTHERLDAFINDNGLKQDDVEDIYPCSPMQEGILLSQAKNPDHYWTRYMWDVVPRANEPGVDLNQLLKSWQQVIDRHATLRAVFAPLSQDGFSDQVILRKGYPDIHVEGQPTAPRQLGENDEKDARHLIQPPYSITIRKLGTRQAQSELRINHALIDAASMGVIKRDLTLAYDGKLSTAHCPRFRDYIAFLQEDTGTADQDYWNGYLEDATPCHFPKLNDCAPEDENGDSAGTMGVHLDSDTGIKQFCKDHGVGITNLFHVVWALVLRRYTEVDSTVFGYITSGRHVPVPGVQDIVGPFINMLVSRINVSEESSILSILQGNQADYAASLSHQNHSLAQTQHSAGHALFNSVVSLQMESPDNTNMADSSSVSMQNIEAEDPTEVSFHLIFAGRYTTTGLTRSAGSSLLR